MIKNNTILLDASRISKQYPGVRALSDVCISIYKGEIRGLVGENGAGKSTFVNILSGVIRPDGGRVIHEGKEVYIDSPRQADELGITVVHQERSLFPNLDIATNLFLSSMGTDSSFFIRDRKLQEKARNLLASVGLSHISPSTKVRRLSPGEQQLVEIARAVARNAKLIIMDEPTSSLSASETEILFRIIRELKNKGESIIYVSHRLWEVFEICDRVTVLRDGCHIRTVNISDITSRELVELILGRKEGEMYKKKLAEAPRETELLRVQHLRREPKIIDVSFSLHEREILGIAGLLGSGRTELLETIFGLDRLDGGKIFIRGQLVHLRSPKHAIGKGIGFVTEDRHREGLILNKSFKDNVTLASLWKYANALGWMQPSKEILAAEAQKQKLNVVTPSLFRKVKFLSGGNQQKTILAKWLETHPKIFIMDDPTRGIDVGTKAEFYRLISNLADHGVGVLLVSSELQELVSLCHRILVLRDGTFIAEYTGLQINTAKILMDMTEGEG